MATTATRPYHHGNLREELLSHAEAALGRGGAQELSLRELAREIGVSHAAPRRHFADKQALLDALAEDGFTRLGSELEQAMERAGPVFRDRFEALARAYVGFATEHAALLDVMFASKHRPGADQSLIEAAHGASDTPLRLIAEAQQTGAIADGDTARVATVLWATLQGLVATANAGLIGDASLDALVHDAVDTLTDGLRPR